VWTANLASLELHTHMWRVDREAPDLVVFDLDPGPPATIVECCRVAGLLRPLLEATGSCRSPRPRAARACSSTPAPTAPSSEQTSAYAKGLAQRLEQEQPDLVVHRMTKALRDGKVLVDWSQNSAAKTTVSVYSLRARERPTVSTPGHLGRGRGVRRPVGPRLHERRRAGARRAERRPVRPAAATSSA
jgi:bifunctional non-homologous end joining protein LigD